MTASVMPRLKGSRSPGCVTVPAGMELDVLHGDEQRIDQTPVSASEAEDLQRAPAMARYSSTNSAYMLIDVL